MHIVYINKKKAMAQRPNLEEHTFIYQNVMSWYFIQKTYNLWLFN